MTTYITKNHSYQVEELNGVPVIRCPLLSANGELYSILGSFDPETFKVRFSYIKGLAKVNGVECRLEELAGRLDGEIKVGSRIVARHIKSNGEYSSMSKTTLLTTSVVQRIE